MTTDFGVIAKDTAACHEVKSQEKSAIWQSDFIERVRGLAEQDEDVVGLVLFGSCCDAKRVDQWSDVDLVLVVKDEAFARYFPTVEWLRRLVAIFALEQHENKVVGVTRICFDDMKRADFLVVPVWGLVKINEWSQPLCSGYKILFSRLVAVNNAFSLDVARSAYEEPPPMQFEKLVNDFWFKAVVAVQKAERNDLLIAAHLALDLSRDCYVLGMMLRDREEKTTVHREGGVGNKLVNEVDILDNPVTRDGIVKTVREVGERFDALAQRWLASYKPHHKRQVG